MAGRILALMLALVLPAAAPAYEPEQREAVVVSARVWDGQSYGEVFLPSAATRMHLVAGRDSALSFVRTIEYDWPLTRRVHVDFERLRVPVEGVLVIRRDGREVARAATEPFALHYPEGAARGPVEMLWGEAALAAHAAHRADEAAFVRDFAAARRAHTAWERQMLAAGAARREGAPPERIDPPPPLPEPSLRLVTPPEPGLRVALPPGDYTMVLEHDGQPVPGTRRALRVVAAQAERVLVAEVVPAERWTRPLPANSPAGRIYARPGATFFLTLLEASRFDEADFLPVVEPQSNPVAGRPVWAGRVPADLDRIAIAWQGGAPVGLARAALKVEHTRGTAFGYRVRPAAPDETPDLRAFAVVVPADPAVSRGGLRHPADGAAFQREIVVVHPRHAALGLALALLPFGLWAATALSRRRRSSPA